MSAETLWQKWQRIAAAQPRPLAGHTHTLLAHSPDPETRWDWACRGDLPVELVRERLEAEGDPTIRVCLLGHPELARDEAAEIAATLGRWGQAAFALRADAPDRDAGQTITRVGASNAGRRILAVIATRTGPLPGRRNATRQALLDAALTETSGRLLNHVTCQADSAAETEAAGDAIVKLARRSRTQTSRRAPAWLRSLYGLTAPAELADELHQRISRARGGELIDVTLWREHHLGHNVAAHPLGAPYSVRNLVLWAVQSATSRDRRRTLETITSGDATYSRRVAALTNPMVTEPQQAKALASLDAGMLRKLAGDANVHHRHGLPQAVRDAARRSGAIDDRPVVEHAILRTALTDTYDRWGQATNVDPCDVIETVARRCGEHPGQLQIVATLADEFTGTVGELVEIADTLGR